MKLEFKLKTIYRTFRRFQKRAFQSVRFFVLRYNSDHLQTLDKHASRSVTTARKQSHKECAFMRRHHSEISALPTDSSYLFMGAYDSLMHVGYGKLSGDPEEIRSAVQKAIHATMATREVHPDTGDISYKLKTKYFIVNIDGAKLATGCELKEVERVSTVFEIVCPDDVDALVVA